MSSSMSIDTVIVEQPSRRRNGRAVGVAIRLERPWDVARESWSAPRGDNGCKDLLARDVGLACATSNKTLEKMSVALLRKV